MPLPNDDMDELMRRAAEEYPLKTGPGDWNAVKKALDAEAPPVSGRKKDNRRFLWLLLLLPLGLICNRYLGFAPGNDEAYTERKAPVPSLSPGENGAPPKRTPTPGTGRQEEPRLQAEQPSIVQPGIPGASGDQPLADKEQALVNRNQSPISNKNIIQQQQPSERRTATTAKAKATKQKTTKPVIKSSTPEADNKEKVYTRKEKEGSSTGQEGTPPPATTAAVTKENAVSALEKYPSADTAAVQGQPKEAITEQHTASTPIAPDSVTAAVATNEKGAKKKDKRFYLGLLAAGDATTIRFQKVDHMGTGYGALAGYELNSKWSIEAGVLSVKKEYYTDGRHFNTSKIYVPQNTQITSVEGNCRMIEIPVAVKYNFGSGRNSWFGTAGISSYLMKAEHYSYMYYYPLTGQSVERYRSYSNSSNHFIASALLSGGYQFRLGRHSTFRLEPYVKVPLKGLGIGSLPLFSTGLQAGFTRKLF
ncbi:MAG TPA: outer membrane beta-barrel protein [Flavisolibacter sp.]|jgi:hypothetical protein